MGYIETQPTQKNTELTVPKLRAQEFKLTLTDPFFVSLFEIIDDPTLGFLNITQTGDLKNLSDTPDRKDKLSTLTWAVNELINNCHENNPEAEIFMDISYNFPNQTYKLSITDSTVYKPGDLDRLLRSLNKEGVKAIKSEKNNRKMQEDCMGVFTLKREFTKIGGTLSYFSHDGRLVVEANWTQNGYDNPIEPPPITFADYHLHRVKQ
jgi:hypothetical protein